MKKILILILTLALSLYYIPSTYADTVKFDTGKQIFEINCAGCHPQGNNIIRRNKNLKWKALQKNGYTSINSIEEIVTHGKNNMSAFGNKLSPEAINEVAKYVFHQAENNWQ